MNDERTYLFEDPVAARLFARWHPEKKALDLPGWVQKLFAKTLPAKEVRLEEFRALGVCEPEKAEATLATIEGLREALVLRQEDVEFCFSTLATTPKNTALKNAFLKYLDSPLAEDWTAHVWTLAERLKQFESVELGISGDLVLVRALETSYLFSELAAALSASPLVASVTLAESWELEAPAEGATARPGVVAVGGPATSIFKLAEHAAKWLERFPDPDKLHFAFHGTREMKSYLGHALDHFRIAFRDETAELAAAATPEGFAAILQKIRTDRTFDLKQRLKLGSILLEDPLGRRPNEDWPQYFEKLERLKKVNSDQRAYLQALVATEAKAAAADAGAGAATIHPFSYPPLRSGHALLVYGDETLFEPPPSLNLLRPGEREALHQAGISLPRPGAQRERHTKLIRALAEKSALHRVFCTSLAPEKLPEGLSPRLLEEREFASGDRSEQTWVELPPKPLSATQLETYARCPAQYFFSQRLRLQRIDAPEAKYPLLFGQATHLALETFFQESEIARSGAVDGEALLMTHFQKALADVAPSLDAGHPLHVIMTEHFRRLARKVPALEKQLQVIEGKGQAIAFEKEFQIDVEGVTLRGKIDRIDKTESGEILVLDYKTGNVDFTPNHIVQGDHFQALLYLLAAETLFTNEKAGLLFYDLKKGEIRRGILMEEKVSPEAKKAVTRGHTLTQPKYLEVREKGIEQLKRLAKGISEGDYSPRPSPQECDMCDYVAVCRKGVGYA